MERLTVWNGRDQDGPRAELADRTSPYHAAIQTALRKLARYEDTGTELLELPESGVWKNQTKDGQNKLIVDGKWIAWNDPITAKERAKTYPGIAKAMAEQWG